MARIENRINLARGSVTAGAVAAACEETHAFDDLSAIFIRLRSLTRKCSTPEVAKVQANPFVPGADLVYPITSYFPEFMYLSG